MSDKEIDVPVTSMTKEQLWKLSKQMLLDPGFFPIEFTADIKRADAGELRVNDVTRVNLNDAHEDYVVTKIETLSKCPVNPLLRIWFYKKSEKEKAHVSKQKS